MSSLAAPLKRWIAQCKAYAAKEGCTYKEAMTALKKKGRKTSHRGGGVADNAFALGGKEGFDAGTPPLPGAAGGIPPSPAAGGMPDAAAAAGGMPPGPPSQSGGQAMFEAGSPQMGGKRRRKSSKRRRSQNRNQSHSQSHSQNGGRRRRGSRSSRRGRRQTKRGGAPLSYSAY